VDEGLDELVPHKYGAWYEWVEGGFVGLLRGFDGPLGLESYTPTNGAVKD